MALDDCSSESIVFISNLHCGSCVKTIHHSLLSLSPPPTDLRVSIVSQSVTLRHRDPLRLHDIISALDLAGFDVVSCSPSSFGGPSRLRGAFAINASPPGVKQEVHLSHCSLCRQEAMSIPKMEQPLNPPSLGALEKAPLSDGPLRVSMSVGGMTCSACSASITRALSDLPGVSQIAVNVLSKSASVVVEQRDLVDIVKESVEDCGFDAHVVSVEPVKSLVVNKEARHSRTVSLQVHGISCRHCPQQVMASLEKFGSKIKILKPIQNNLDPIFTVSYTPCPPSFTIRTIIDTVASAKYPPFEVSIHRPPTIEDMARSMRAREQRHLLFRLVFSIIVAIPTFIIGIVYMSLVRDGDPVRAFLMEPMWTGNTSRIDWALFFLATPIMFYSASLFHRRSIKELRALWRRGSSTPILRRFTRFGSMNLLVSTGVSVAYFSSTVLLALAAAQPASPEKMGDTTTYFDSVVFLTMFLLAGRFMEAYSKARTADAITALGRLRPAEALLLVPQDPPSKKPKFEIVHREDIEKGDVDKEDNSQFVSPSWALKKIDASLLEVGDVVRVQNGSTPPADGSIVSAEGGSFDESSLTGESRLIQKQVGDEVFLGTINKARMVDIKVTAVGGDTMLDKIVDVVREGQSRRAPIERVADLLTGYFVPIVTLLAILTWVVWLTLGLSGALPGNYLDIKIGGWPVWSLQFAIAVFVVACPCGIGLAAPTALLVGSGLAAKFGILARGGGEAFQEMAQLDVVVFDKTGTLTEGGEPQVSDIEMLCSDHKLRAEEILGIAMELESASSHPLAVAVRNYCGAHEALPVTGSGFEETPGRGLKGHFKGMDRTAVIGNEAWVEEHGAVINKDLALRLATWKSEAKSVVLVAIRGTEGAFQIAAAFAVSDHLRPEAKAVVASLHKQRIGTWMISGDNLITAQAVAKMVGIPMTNVIAGVLPHEKAEKVQWLQKVGSKRQTSNWRMPFAKRRLNERCVVAMVGDGINDAPALAASDIGIAIGSGSDVAISSASFVLVSSNLRSLLTLSGLSRKVFDRVKFNFLWAVMYNLTAVPIAAGVLFPAGHIRLNPVWAALAMALSSVSVVCSSLLLKLYKEPK